MPRVTLLHGFSQTAGSWRALTPALEAAGLEVCAPDLPGHGRRQDEPADLWTAADVVLADGGTSAYVGYSLGGRIALHAALRRPDRVERLVLIGATAGIDDDAERAARRAADEERAATLERDGVAAFVDEWLRGPLFATLAADAAARDERVAANSAAGLAASLRLAGTGTMSPLWDDLPRLCLPVQCVVGDLDVKFRALAQRMVDAIGPNASLAIVPGAGHACHLEQPQRFLEVVLPFLGEEVHETASPSA